MTLYTLTENGRRIAENRWKVMTPDQARKEADDFTARADRLRELADQAEANEAVWRARVEDEIARIMAAHPGSERVGDSVIALATDERGIPAWRAVYGVAVHIPEHKQPLTWAVIPRRVVAHAIRGGNEALCGVYSFEGWTVATEGTKRCRTCLKRVGGWEVAPSPRANTNPNPRS